MPTLLISLLRAAGGVFLSKLLGAAITEKVIAAVTFDALEWLAKQTSNGVDDKLVEQVKQAYEAEPPAGN